MRILLITPPMVQVNTPYPATPYLTGFLRAEGIAAEQADASLELALRVFSRTGLKRVIRTLNRHRSHSRQPAHNIRHFLMNQQAYVATIEPVIRFLQGREPALAHRIVSRRFLPEGPRFDTLKHWAHALAESSRRSGGTDDRVTNGFGRLGLQDQAKHLASLYVDDVVDVVRTGIDSRFELARYAEQIGAHCASLDPYLAELAAPPTLIDRMLVELTSDLFRRHQPRLVGFTIPFPGALYGALRMAAILRATAPSVRIVLGGGFVNTELRRLSDPRLFNLVDYVLLDEGYVPLLRLTHAMGARRSAVPLVRTFKRQRGAVRFCDDPHAVDLRGDQRPTPCYAGLPMDRYFSLVEVPNPMHRLWSDGRWNKLILARGCYWHRCSFCDTALPYIRRFDPASATFLVQQIETVAKATSHRGFHFVDEAAPPALLRSLSARLVERNSAITWWTNLRFETGFTSAFARRMARAGCVAVSGGLETAEPRTLDLIQKGITLTQATRVLRNFADAGILVHAYLMYGFPGETVQETIDALEYLRQLFRSGCVHSAYWHRFALTVHSPMGHDPQRFGIQVRARAHAGFTENELAFDDGTGTDLAVLGEGLRKALYNYLYGIGVGEDVRAWFSVQVPRPRLAKTFVDRILRR